MPSAVAPAPSYRLRRWPARLDVLQSATGLALAVFLLLHSAFVGSLLLGHGVFAALLAVADGSAFFGRPYPVLHVILAATITLLLVVHASLAVRKFPEGYRQYRAFRDHAQSLRHTDTTLWFWQVVTGFLLFFLAFVHLYTMMTQADRIGPVESAMRIVDGRMWLLYLVLTPVVQFHSLVGLYRLAWKWGWVGGDDPARTRQRLRRILGPVIALFIVVGLLTLASEIRVGLERSTLKPAPAVVEGTPS